MSLNGFFTNRRGLIGLGAAALIAASAAWAPASAETPTYKVGSTPTGVPFTFLDVKSNKISGVMVDIITAIGEEEGFTPDVKATQWSALIPSLTSDKIDIIAAAMYATEERAKVVDFTDTVYSYGEGLFVSKDDETEYKTPQDLEGKTVGVQVGTAYIEPMKALGVFKEVKIYDSIPRHHARRAARPHRCGLRRPAHRRLPALAGGCECAAGEELRLHHHRRCGDVGETGQ